MFEMNFWSSTAAVRMGVGWGRDRLSELSSVALRMVHA
jgi:hypothetical protein